MVWRGLIIGTLLVSQAEALPAGALRGRVLEKGTRAPLAGARAIIAQDGQEERAAVVEADGTFVLADLVAGTWRLTLFSPDHERLEEAVELAGEALERTWYVARVAPRNAVVVRAPRPRQELSRRTLSAEEIRNVPGTYGDAVRVVSNLPGVARTPLGMGPIVVRGGRAGDTRTYVDGQYVPLLFHFGGGPSVLNADLLKALDLHAGNAPVRFGRSIAGVIDVETRTGRRERVGGAASLSVTDASAFAEGPVGAHGSFMASVRRSHVDLVLPFVLPLVRAANGYQLTPRYWDYQLKGDFDVGANALSFFVFGSDDRLELVTTGANAGGVERRSRLETAIGFHRLTAGWARKLGDGLTHRLAATLGSDATTMSYGPDITGTIGFQSLTLREELGLRWSETLRLRAGLDLVLARYSFDIRGPPMPRPGELRGDLLADQLVQADDRGLAAQPGLYLESTKRFGPVEVVGGLRWDYDGYLDRQWFDPRVTVIAQPTRGLVVRGAAGLYHQPPSPEKLSRGFGNPDLVEEGAAQYGVGAEWRFAERYGLDAELYYKDIFSETVSSRTNFSNTGEGRAAGAELLVRRSPGPGLSGWVALSVAHTERRDGPDAPWRTSFLDQRYNLVAVASHRLPWDLELGARLRVTDGSPTTPVTDSIFDADSDSYLPLPSTTTERLPLFFQLDVRVDRRFVFDTWVLNAFVDVQNVTNRANVEGVRHSFDYRHAAPLTGLPILPSVGVRGEL